MSDFLEKLKKAADTGEFNSEAAKKILEINELADKKLGNGTEADLENLKEKLKRRVAGELEEVKATEAVPEEVEATEVTPEEVKGTEVVPEEPEEKKSVEAPESKVSEEEVAVLNSIYEKKMANLKLIDSVNAQLATLIEIEDMVKMSIDDMFGFIKDLEDKFSLEFEKENPIFGDLYLKIEEIQSKYKY